MNFLSKRTFLLCVVLSSLGNLIIAGTASAASTDASLTAIAASAKNTFQLQNDPGQRMRNYLQTHFSAAATRLASVCSMTNVAATSGNVQPFSGTSADQGAILGIDNNTQSVFTVKQNNVIIGQVMPGWNGDVVFNLAALNSSATSTAALPSITLVPDLGTSQLIIRVMTGAQLFAHINSVVSRESTNAKSQITFYKNGQQPLPGVNDQQSTASDLYLVVENESSVSGMPLAAPARRIQVLNLSNITNIYTVSLQITQMGLALVNNQVSLQNELENIFALGIQGVHILNTIQGHTVPLLLMPRAVYQAGAAVNSLYAAYIALYAKNVADSYAGTAAVYYDLVRVVTHEPFEYLRTLKYFDFKDALKAVVDQNAIMSSGQNIGTMIFTDVFGAYAQDVSTDLSFVACNSSGFDVTDNDHIMFGLANSQIFNTSSVSHNVSQSKYVDVKIGAGGFFTGFTMAINQEIEKQQQSQLAATDPDALSPVATSYYPVTNITNQLLPLNAALYVHPLTLSLEKWNSSGHWYGAGFYTSNPLNLTAGQSFNQNEGSFNSAWWGLKKEDWIAGIKIVPVFYNVNTYAPFASLQDFGRVSSSLQSALYLYTYKNDELIGVLPALNSGNTAEVYVYPMPTLYVEFLNGGGNQFTTLQSPGYETFGIAKPNAAGLVTNNYSEIKYPGYGYLTLDSANQSTYCLVRNKWPDMSELNKLVLQSWFPKNMLSGAWLTAVSTTDAQAGIIVQVEQVSVGVYEIIVMDSQNNIITFQEIYAPNGADALVAMHVQANGSFSTQTKPMSLSSGINYFKLLDTQASGIVLVQTTAPQAKQAKSVVATPSAKAPVVSDGSEAKDQTQSSGKVIKENKKLKAENKKLKQKNKKLKQELIVCRQAKK